MQNNSPLRRYQQIRERLYRICEDAARFASAAELDVIDDPLLESLVVLQADETTAAVYQRKPLAQLITARAAQLRTPFRIAVMGEFSRGKSTFINALLGQKLLVTNWRPNTAVRTVIRAGTPQSIRVEYLSGEKPSVKITNDIARELAALTSDAEDGDNQDGLLRGTRESLSQKYKEVEVFADLPFLREREIELIDTPGLGSVFESHQGVAYGVLAQADMILYTIQFTPGIEATDIDFLLSVRNHKNRFLFLLTKRNHAKTPAELQDIVNLVSTSLQARVGIQQPKIYPVEAAFALNGHAAESGMAQAIYGIESGLVTISGVPRMQTVLRFLTTCCHWFSQSLAHKAQNLEQTLRLLNQRRDLIAFRTGQVQQMQSILREYTRSSFTALLTELKASINELPLYFQVASEMVIDRLEPNKSNTSALLGPQIVAALQIELQSWLREKEKYMERQRALVSEHIRQSLAFLSPSSSGGMVNIKQASLRVSLQPAALQPLFSVVVPAIIDLTAKLGMSDALRSVHARYKQHLLAPVRLRHISLYQIVIDGISFTHTEQQQPRDIIIAGIRKDLENAFAQTCEALSVRCEQLIDANIRLALSHLAQERDKVNAEYNMTKKTLDSIVQRNGEIEAIKREMQKIELESKNMSPAYR